jgi:hypothetical protein
MIPNLARAAANENPPGHSTASTHALLSSGSVSHEGAGLKDAGGLGSATAVASGSSGTSTPSFARYLKRVISEDGHVSTTLVHLLQVIVRNRDMFYHSR